jgi:hypothetical protein
VHHELEAGLGARHAVFQVFPPDVDDRPQHGHGFSGRHPDAEVVGQARPGRKAAAHLHGETRPALSHHAQEGYAVDLRRVALVRAGRDGDLVLARQVRVFAVAHEEVRGLLEHAPGVEQLVAVEPGDRAAGDVPHVVAAGAGRGQAPLVQDAQHLGQAAELQPVELDVLPGRELAVAAAEAL